MSELSCADEDHPLKLAEPLPVSAVKTETEGTIEQTPLVLSIHFKANIYFYLFRLKSSTDSNQLCEKITKELDSVAVDWKSLRTTTACSCTTPFDQFSRKVN